MAQTFVSACEAKDIFIEHIPGGARHQNGKCERFVREVKETLTRMDMEEPAQSPADLISAATQAHNTVKRCEGFSPSQIVLGMSPNHMGLMLSLIPT